MSDLGTDFYLFYLFLKFKKNITEHPIQFSPIYLLIGHTPRQVGC